METLASFGEWLRRRRVALGLTRAELSNCAGCSVSALRKIESDQRRPSRQLAGLLAGCLDIAPEEQPAFVDAARGLRAVARLGQPQPATRELAAPAPARVFSTGAVPSTPFWNLPTPATPLIGREAELEALVQLLEDPDCRLLTVLGPGGIGKTRLALEAACAVWGQFAGEVYFIPLEAATSAEFIAPAIAQALHINFAGAAELEEQLINVLRYKEALLFLDNVEHLLDGVGLLAEILARAPTVKLLVTSRQRLQLRGEWGFEVQGLPAPAAEQAYEVETFSAVQLFLHRARRVRVDFEPSTEEMRHIVRICRLVEGMPLALEFAAAWAAVLSCEEIAGEIERGLDILATTMRDVPERQRSLGAVFEQSWRLLTAEERRAMRQLAVFRGGFRREAARAVAGADLVLISSLLAKSFLRRTASGQFSMHDLVRQYAGSRLAEDPREEEETHERHALYYMDYLPRLESELKGARQHEALRQMDEEAGNIRSAWRRAVRLGDPAVIYKPIRALWYYYDIRGWFQEAQATFRWAAQALETQIAAQTDSAETLFFLQQYARAQEGWFCLRVGHFEEAERLLQRSVEVLRAAPQRTWLVDALQHAGALQRLMGNYARSRALYEEMHHFAVETNDSWNATIAWGDIGLAAQAQGNLQEAYRYMAESVRSFRQLGDSRMLGVALHFLGAICCIMGTTDEADGYLQEGLHLSRSIGDRWIESMTLRELGNVALEMDSLPAAARLFKESLTLARELGEHWCILQALNCLGSAHLALAEDAAAHDAFEEALVMSWQMQALPDVMAALVGLAQWAARQTVEDAALQAALVKSLLALNHPAASQKTKETARRLQLELEERLPSALVQAAHAMAQTASMEAVAGGEIRSVARHEPPRLLSG